jgi:hypothetical protein
MSLFLVERYLRLHEGSAQALEESLRGATAVLRSEGVEIAWLTSIALPDEDTCLCVFRAASAADVVAVNRLAGVEIDRIVPALLIHRGEM